MSQKLSDILYNVGGFPTEHDVNDIVFTVLEEYGEGFDEWLMRTVAGKNRHGYRLFGTENYLSWPEIVKEYRKYLIKQNTSS